MEFCPYSRDLLSVLNLIQMSPHRSMTAFQGDRLEDVDFRIKIASMKSVILFLILWLCRRRIFRTKRRDTEEPEETTVNVLAVIPQAIM